jgi:hypothetical protein
LLPRERSLAGAQLIGAMTLSYQAFGLDLRSEFPLPGMTRCGDRSGHPLALELTDPATVLGAWSGSERTATWRGRLGDGRELSIARGPAADLLFADADRAFFHLDAAARRLLCAPRREGAEWQRTLLARILPSVRLARGYEALHASAVACSRGVVAIAGPSGTGKTTLALELMTRGMPLVCDDVLTLSIAQTAVLGHPAPPQMNVGERASVAVEHRELAAGAGERWIELAGCTTDLPQRVSAVCVLERTRGASLGVESLAATPLLLAPYMLGLPDDERERERDRFELYSRLARQAALLRVTADLDDRVEDVADALEQALALDDVAIRGAA